MGCPIISLFEGPLRKSQKHAKLIVKRCQKQMEVNFPHRVLYPRLILSYRMQGIIPCFIQLYILPISKENDFILPEGRFFSCEEIKLAPESFSEELRMEHERLQMVAQIWKEFK